MSDESRKAALASDLSDLHDYIQDTTLPALESAGFSSRLAGPFLAWTADMVNALDMVLLTRGDGSDSGLVPEGFAWLPYWPGWTPVEDRLSALERQVDYAYELLARVVVTGQDQPVPRTEGKTVRP